MFYYSVNSSTVERRGGGTVKI